MDNIEYYHASAFTVPATPPVAVRIFHFLSSSTMNLTRPLFPDDFLKDGDGCLHSLYVENAE